MQSNKKIILFFIFFSLLFTHIFLFPTSFDLKSDLITFFIIFIWIIITKICHFNSSATFIVVLLNLFLAFFLILFKEKIFIEKVFVWIYIYLLFGVIQRSIEIYKKK